MGQGGVKLGGKGGEPGGVGTGAGGDPQGKSGGGAVGAAVLRAPPQRVGRRRDDGSALRIPLRGPLRNGSSAFRRSQALGGMDRLGPGPGLAPALPAPPAETPLSAAPLPPLPPTWGPSRCLIRQGEEAQELPLQSLPHCYSFIYIFFLRKRHRATDYQFLRSCFLFFPFPRRPP